MVTDAKDTLLDATKSMMDTFKPKRSTSNDVGMKTDHLKREGNKDDEASK